MSNHFYMGAINKLTNDYEYPKIADKNNKYKCPNCEKDVIFRKGKIKQPHFAHKKSDNPCYYYDKPNESQIHKDAKLLMKKLLDNKTYISINVRCKYCENRGCPYYDYEGYDYNIFKDDYNENTKAVIEHNFKYNNSNRFADVAFLENNIVKCIFEIHYKNKTKDVNRPEPWFEIEAEDLINNINSIENIDENGATIDCIRDFKCDECKLYEEEEKKKWNEYQDKLKRKQMHNELIEKVRTETEKREKQIKLRLYKEQLEIQKRIEYDKKRREEEDNINYELCKCNIKILNICRCQNPKFEIVKHSNNLYCVGCNKWKCRC
jgi:hypothetical protein